MMEGLFQMKSNKAQIGSSISWIVAFLVIFFIMFLFIGMITILLPQIKKAEVSHGELSSFGESLVVRDFLERYDEELFEWVENDEVGKVKSSAYGYELLDTISPAYPHFKKLELVVGDFLQEYDFEDPYFYIRTEDREIWITSSIQGKDKKRVFHFETRRNLRFRHSMDSLAGVPTVGPNTQASPETLRKRELALEYPLNRFFISSDKGKLIMISFHENFQDEVVGMLFDKEVNPIQYV